MKQDNGSEPSALNDEITRITDPLMQISPTATDDLVVVSLQRLLGELKPRQAELVQRCAIPRWFDAEVLDVLRDDRSGDGRAFDVIRSYSFVRPLGDDRYAYHDQVRVVLLRAWDALRPDDRRALHQRLAVYFRERAEAALQRAVTPPNATPAASAAPAPLSAAPMGRWELYTREALYHTLHADPASGMEQLRAAFDRAEATHRRGDTEALLQLAADVPLDAEAQRWVAYLRARVEVAALRLDAAAAQLNALRDTLAGQPPSLLAANVSQTLGEVYAETGRWVDATALYRQSLAYFEATGRQHEAAQVQLRIGAAYQELAANTGGWHVPAYPQRRFWRALAQLGDTLLALPFYVISVVLRRTPLVRRYPPFALPGPRYLAFYQNWLLIWLYRTARRWYERARAGFVAQHDAAGASEAEQCLGQIALIFGYPDEALARLDPLREKMAGNGYACAWIDRDRAEALLALGRTAEAEALLHAALAVFTLVGDMRREAAVLALQSRIAAQRGDTAAALAGYRSSLARFRALHYTAAREQVLHDLRAWRRMAGPGAVAEQVGALLAAEPEKRYVGRFVRSQLAWLQVLSVAAFPLTLLLLAIFAPTIRTDLFQSLVRQSFYFDPWRALTVVGALLLFYSLAYALVAFGVIFVIPFDTLAREQPDYFVTDAEGIARYDYRGTPVERLRWADLRRWVRYDRRLWELPHPLFSATYLDTGTQRLRIDGITGWYTSLQDDIGQHLAAVNSPVQSEDRGYNVIRSRNGVSVLVGLLLILLCAGVENGWFHLLIALLPPWLYALVWLLAFSNALILFPFNYWFAIRPLALRRALGIRDWWPATVGLVGVGAIILARAHGEGQPLGGIPALAVGLTIWGAHMIAEAVATRFFPRRLAARTTVIAAAVFSAALTVLPLALTVFLGTWSRAASQRTALFGTTQAFAPLVSQADATTSAEQSLTAARILVWQPDATAEQKARAYANAGQSLYAAGASDQAIQAYDQALAIYTALLQENPRAELRAALAGVHFNRGQALKAQGDGQGWQQELRTACALDAVVAPECR